MAPELDTQKEEEGNNEAVTGDGAEDKKSPRMNGSISEEAKKSGEPSVEDSTRLDVSSDKASTRDGSSTSDNVVGNELNESKSASTNGHSPETPKSNGKGAPKTTPGSAANSGGEDTRETTKLDLPGAEPSVSNSSANLDKPVSAPADNTTSMLSADPKDEGAVSGGSAPANTTEELGSILKGSPFEKDKAGKTADVKSEKHPTSDSKKKPAQQGKAPSAGTINGKPKEADATKAGSRAKSKANPPANIQTQTHAGPTSSAPTGKSGNQVQKPKYTGASAPNSATGSAKQLLPKIASPKSSASKDAKKDGNKDIRKPTSDRSSRPSAPLKNSAIGSTSKPTAATNSSTTKAVKAPVPTSPQTLTKPRPKSPTRPVRLPASATAQTAASAAKLDTTAPPFRPSSRSSIASTHRIGERTASNSAIARDRARPNQSTTKSGPGRSSLPAGSKPVDKAKSRLSTAGAKASEGSFLERMMRPTQSSASKTHDKTEVKTPPKKATGMKPKRKSDESEIGNNEHGEVGHEQPHESLAQEEVPKSAGSGENIDANEAEKESEKPAAAILAETTS